MDFLLGVLYFFFIVAALLIILIVLFRPSEGGGLAGSFGGMGSDNVFGVRATQMIDKVVATIAATFVLLALLIGVISASQQRTGEAEEAVSAPPVSAPADPGTERAGAPRVIYAERA